VIYEKIDTSACRPGHDPEGEYVAIQPAEKTKQHVQKTSKIGGS